jgi:metal-sulfur cluster biosynthetic enzyme
MPGIEHILDALSQVVDPELDIDVVNLGLCYDVEVDGGKVSIRHTFTSPSCPAAPLLRAEMHRVVRILEGVDEVELELTFEPPWSPARLSEDARFALGLP